MVSFMQSRLGPMEAGPYGSLQLMAEVGKFAAEGRHRSSQGRRAFVFKAAPYVVLHVHVPARRGGAVRARRVVHPDFDTGVILRPWPSSSISLSAS